eukprot:TRINITY_DN4462_c0_g1_i13.p2 TRINITY_DN4462_c0_g1~~TRINITY_DN4462_c0_g1_i13.p2  ORF type:complete len:137 (-),score=15.35 TRINITY_DN4462_c0_g1_i13:662-1072(-)
MGDNSLSHPDSPGSHRYSLTIKVHAFKGNGIIGIFAVPPLGAEPKDTPPFKHVFMTHPSVAWGYNGELFIDNNKKEYHAQTDRWVVPVRGRYRNSDKLNWAHFFDDNGEEGEDGDVECSETPTVRLDLELLSPVIV